MNRRTLLAGLVVPFVGGTALVAQRLDYRRDKEFSIRTAPSITGHQFKIVEYSDRYSNGDEPDDSMSNHAAVEFEPSNDDVRIVGRIPSGGRSCMETELKTLRYDESSDTLAVAVFDDYVHHDICTKGAGPVLYAVDVRFESNLPSRVVVEHVKDGDGVVYEESITRQS